MSERYTAATRLVDAVLDYWSVIEDREVEDVGVDCDHESASSKSDLGLVLERGVFGWVGVEASERHREWRSKVAD